MLEHKLWRLLIDERFSKTSGSIVKKVYLKLYKWKPLVKSSKNQLNNGFVNDQPSANY